MGRKRIKNDVEEALRQAEKVHHMDLKDEDGLYPHSLTWQWKAKNGKDKGKTLRLTVDVSDATRQELNWLDSSSRRFFYSEFNKDFPWAVNALARALKTMCLNNQWSIGMATQSRWAIGEFFGYCRQKEVQLESSKDMSFMLLCEWRNSLRSIDKQSRYKALFFRAFTRVFEILLGTSVFPEVYTLPVYLSDSNDPIRPYSDAVMYQLISACVGDISQIMSEAELFATLATDGTLPAVIKDISVCSSWADVVNIYVARFSHRFSAGTGEPDISNVARSMVSYALARLRDKSPAKADEFLERVKLICHEDQGPNSLPFKRLAEKEVATRGSLVPFLIFFLIFSGKNKEVVLTWKRSYKVNGVHLSPLDWKDPVDPSNCRVRGVKSRGKNGVEEVDDTYIKIEDGGLCSVLRFLIWYTEPLTKFVDSSAQDSLWLFQGKTGVKSFYTTDPFSKAIRGFMGRHEIWEVEADDNGSPVRQRLKSLDSRRFRKVFASKEMLKFMGEAQNFEELCASLMHALNHKDFDTTLSKYIGGWAQKEVSDLGIFALQTKYVEAARSFRGSTHPNGVSGTTPGLYVACADSSNPDYEGAPTTDTCHEFDMCLGCSQSRVFIEHLPRIAMRVLQYEQLRSEMPSLAWEAAYSRKLARALDLLACWDDQSEVKSAWDAAKQGQIRLPHLIARS
ncbi:hypothetical protein ACAW49_08205 [Pseudomonas sp. Env-44]|uniref:hypothetical protein n=1 Tax=unclassified Pseudomonas TaxID=196821 RepID=UPI00351F9CCE